MKVITFSRTFPATHPQKGTPTFFPEKIIRSLGLADQYISESRFDWLNDFSLALDEPKVHTIRGGNRWNVGDWFSPRVWSGKPYASPQIEFAPPIQIKKIWPIGLRIRGDFKEFYSGDCDLTRTSIHQVAKNDGLEVNDFLNWFSKPFEGQIICWNENIIY